MYLIVLNGNFGSSQITEIPPTAFSSFHEASTMAEIALSHQKARIQEVIARHPQNAKDNTYSFSPINEPSIPRWAIDPIDIYPGLELELKRGNRNYQWYGIEPGIHKVRSVSIDNLQCNISVINGEAWSHVNDGDLYLPAKESQGA